ncbi:MAG: ATP-binding cassette domain-containing protein [Lachnospirales bacterium]
MLKIFKFAYMYIYEYKISFYIYTATSLIVSIIAFSIPYLNGKFIDILVYSDNLKILYFFCFIIIIFNILRLLLGYYNSLIYTRIQSKTGFKLNKDAIIRLQKTELIKCENMDMVYNNQIINNDSNTIMMFIIPFIQNFLVNISSILIALFLVASISRTIFFVMIMCIFLYVFLYKLYREKLYNTNKELTEAKSNFFSTLFEQLNLISFIKVNNIYTEMKEKLNAKFRSFYKVIIKNQKVNYVFSGLDTIISIMAQSILVLVAGTLVMKKKITIGEFTIMSTYFALMLKSATYFLNLSKSYESVKVSYDRISELMAWNNEKNGNAYINKIKKIELQNITFGYEKSLIFNNLNMKFEEGNIYALKGENGVGKSTLMKIIMGLYQPEGGVFYNDISINGLDMEKIRRNNIAMCEQQPTILDGTFEDNMFIYEKIESIKSRKLEEFLNISKFLNSSFSPKNLSGGEKQRITLFRTFIKDADIILLDEPTAALDKNTERNFYNYLDSIKKTKIIILISHSEVGKICDYVYEI